MELFRLFGTIAVNNEEANSAIDETTGMAEQSESRMSGAFKKIGTAIATYFAAEKIIAFGKEVVNVAAEVSAEASAFEQIMGDYSEQASEKINKIADATGMVSTRLTPYMTSMTAKFKGLGYDIDDATDLASDGLNLAADAAAFWDKSLDDSMSALNSFINGSYEGGEAIGLFANDTQLASYAVKNGIVSETKEWANLDEARKQATRLEYAQTMFEMSGATGQAAKEADQYANVQTNLTEKWRQFKAQIGEPLLQNIVLPAMQKLSDIVDKLSPAFEKLQKWVSEHKETLVVLGEVIGVVTAAILAYNVAMGAMSIVKTITTALNGMTVAQYALNLAMSLNPIGLVVAAIAALVAAFVILWNKSETFRNFWIGLWDKIKNVASAFVEWLKQAWEAIGNFFATTVPGWFESFKNFFENIWNSISNFFSTIWETIKNVLSVAIQFIVEIIKAAFNLITLPFRFIWENCKDTIISIWEKIKSAVSTAINAIKTVITTVFNAIKSVITTIWNAIKTVITTVWSVIKTIITTYINTIKTIITTVFNAIKTVITTIFNAVKTFVSNVWNGIKTTISGIINGIKTTVTNVFNTIKTAITSPLESAKNTVSNIFDKIKNAIGDKITAAKNKVHEMIEAIKAKFNFKWNFPKLKLPHFSISGKFSLNPPSIPHFSVDWYQKAMDNAMLLNSPTIFGVDSVGQLMGGGEAGQEVVSGSDTLMNMIRGAVKEETTIIAINIEKLISMLAEYFPEILKNMDRDIVFNDGVVAAKLAPLIDSRLGDINRLRERGK